MREIKFRAWDDKEIIYSDNIAYDKKLRNERLASFFDDCYDCEIMQYTGLKDKSGKEIYEGDIVKGESNNPFSGGISVVNIIYSDPSARFHAEGTSFENLGEWLSYNNLGIEVIGNIYENSELLEPKHQTLGETKHWGNDND